MAIGAIGRRVGFVQFHAGSCVVEVFGLKSGLMAGTTVRIEPRKITGALMTLTTRDIPVKEGQVEIGSTHVIKPAPFRNPVTESTVVFHLVRVATGAGFPAFLPVQGLFTLFIMAAIAAFPVMAVDALQFEDFRMIGVLKRYD